MYKNGKLSRQEKKKIEGQTKYKYNHNYKKRRKGTIK